MSSPWQRLAADGLADMLAAGFHPPVPNNYVELLIPRRHAVADRVRAIAEATAPLNRADAGLLAACSEIVATRAPDDERLQGCLTAWRDCIARRVNLRGIEHATALFACAEHRLAGGMLTALRCVAPAAITSFVELPRPLQRVLRCNGYLPPGQLGRFAEAAARIVDDPDGAVDRIELARIDRAMSHPPSFPTVIVYLDARRDSPRGRRALAIWRRCFAALPRQWAPRPGFAQQVAHNLCVSEGFALYKRYLVLLGVLSAVYAPAFDHAFAYPDDRVRRPRMRRAGLKRGRAACKLLRVDACPARADRDLASARVQ